MKTPRHVLFDKHAATEPKLDSLRQRFITILPTLGTEPLASARKVSLESGRPGWREFFLGFRWHLAGLSGAWILVALLRISAGTPATSAEHQAKQISPQTVIVALKANRRQVWEFGEATMSGGPAVLPARSPTRRSSLEHRWNYC
jgi:hypothetical protein